MITRIGTKRPDAIASAVTLAVGEIQFQDGTRQRLENGTRGIVALKEGDADAASDIMKAQNTVGDRHLAMESFREIPPR